MIGKMVRRRAVDYLLLFGIAVAFLLVFRHAVPTVPFAYDEADYMSVGRAGFWNNYTEPQSLNLINFVDIGLKALRGQMARTGLSDYIRDRHDTSFLRHYHGALYSYWLSLANAVSGGTEYGARFSGFVFHLLTFATLVLGVPWALGKDCRLAGWLSGLVYLFSVTNILTATELSSHVVFMWVSMLVLILIARFANHPTKSNYYVALGGCALALAALEYGILLFASLAVAVIPWRKELLAQWSSGLRFVLSSAGVAIATLLVVWPASLLKGTIFEGYLFIGYLAKYRKGSFGTLTPLGVWAGRFHMFTADCLVVWLCVFIALALLWRSPRRNSLLPVFLFSALMLGTTLKNTAEGVRYFSEFPAPLLAVAAVLLMERLHRVPVRVLACAIAAVGAALGIMAWHMTINSGARQDVVLTSLLGAIRKAPAHTVLVPSEYRPAVSYYFPDRVAQSFVATADRDTLTAQIERGNPDMACVYGWQALPGETVAQIESSAGRMVCSLRR